MPGFHGPNATGAPPDSDYEWRYEYYDDEPISFDGLQAHRYSIVIGFWVGLAVFVIFMFFVLTLLTKTGAPHPDCGEPCEKRAHPSSCIDALSPNNTAPPIHPRSLHSSHSLFQCYMTEEDQGGSGAPWAREGGGWAGGRGRSGRGCAQRSPGSLGEEGEDDDTVLKEEPAATERETVLLTHFSIPNFVNTEQSLTLGDEDLQLGESELPIILEGRGQTDNSHHLTE
ncbi:melanocortin-2 receptor accessory protein 2A [Myripristis murdjan]|uniref:Melanocortin 2 receptor accessory protein 2a n=1 Tax=Myripristis murdjan TaxID=586833 RepID=A0A667ZZA4_9TELE|nr:melanocortin-2 receptor accessory protein 2A-like [Myripristis murdjan]